MGPKEARKTGSEAVEEAIASFERIIEDLNTALDETKNEIVDVEIAIVEAEREALRLTKTMKKGNDFISGLRTLLKG